MMTVPLLTAVLLLAQETVGDGMVPESEAVNALLKPVTFMTFVQASLAMLIAYGILLSIRSAVGSLSENVPRRFRLVIKQSVPFLKGIVLVFTISYLLQLFLNLTGPNLLALTGTIAVALGFAFKDYASSIVAGVVNLFEGPFRMGDRIQIGEHYGEVVDYGLRGLLLQTPDDNAVTIPHNATWTSPISNANSGQLEAQVATDFYFSHEADTDLVTEILYQAAYSSRYTQLKLPVVVVVIEEPWATHLKLKPGYLTSEKESGASTSENVITTRHSAVCNDAPDPNRV